MLMIERNLSYRTEQSWIDSTWVDKIKIVKDYTEDGLLQEEIKSIWNETNWLDDQNGSIIMTQIIEYLSNIISLKEPKFGQEGKS